MMLTLRNFKEHLSRQLLIAAYQYLKEGNTMGISENDEGCYDALIREGDTEHWVEVTLVPGTRDIIEDCFCSKCNSLFCVHTVAVLQLISETAKINAQGYSNNKFLPS